MSKPFHSNKITLAELRALICSFAKQRGVNRVIFNNRGTTVKGTYCASNKNMYVNLDQTKKAMMHTFFHELAHHEAVVNSLWLDYHFDRKFYSSEDVFLIENNIDRIAQRLWQTHVNSKYWGRYIFAYNQNKKQFLIKNFISQWNIVKLLAE